MVRKTIGFLVTVAVTLWAGYNLAWAADLRERLFDNPGRSFLLLALVAAAAGMLVWGVMRPNGLKVVLAFVLGMAAWAVGRWVLEGIEWQQVWVLVGSIAVLAGLYVWTVLDSSNVSDAIVKVRRLRSKQTASSAGAPLGTTSATAQSTIPARGPQGNPEIKPYSFGG